MTQSLKYGRLAARIPVELCWFHHYISGGLPAAPAAVSVPDVANYEMLGNDEVGDCTCAGVVHLDMATAAKYAEAETSPDTNTVVQTYFTLTHGQDSGLVEADVLRTWQTAGLFGHKIAGYAPANAHNLDEMKSIISLFGGAYLGVQMPAPAQQQFAAGEPWDLTDTSADNQIEGGHCIIAIGYDSEYFEVVTWGAVQKVTPRWFQRYLDEQWAVITSEDAAANGGVDLDRLQADLKLVQ